MLHELFAQSKNYPAHYAWLHSWMRGNWPDPSAELKPYDPSLIFLDAHKFAVSNTHHSDGELLGSMRDMLERGLVAEDQRKLVVEAACAIWGADPEEAAVGPIAAKVQRAGQSVGLHEAPG